MTILTLLISSNIRILPALLLCFCFSLINPQALCAEDIDPAGGEAQVLAISDLEGIMEQEFYISTYDMYAQEYSSRSEAASEENTPDLFSQIPQCSIQAHARAAASGLNGAQLAMNCGGSQFD